MESPILLDGFTFVHDDIDYHFSLIYFSKLNNSRVLVTSVVTPNPTDNSVGIVRIEFDNPIKNAGSFSEYPGTTVEEDGFKRALYMESVRQLSILGLIEIADPNQ